ncbi:MAG TPA: murein biosynthesis integral membrane protein MurJ [Myxococcaceae bacterium]|nr:murein biosynthesis integral membrane protein MurJ [Myxococcaceae bacterium]
MKELPRSAAGAAAAAPRSAEAGPHPGVSSKQDESGSGAFFVGAGILLSRIVGLIRESVFAHYLGNSLAAAAFKAAIRIPNVLQNLFGEGVLSASFIPVYARLVGRGDREEADRVAGAVFGILSLLTSLLVVAGVLGAPLLIDVIAPGFKGEARELTLRLVQILFPGVGFLVMSAWCLGILNSHRRFFIGYAAPVIWNAAQIAVLVGLGRSTGQQKLVEYVAYGMVAGSFLQFAIQLPPVLRLLGTFRPAISTARESVRQVFRGFLPVVLGRGVVQISAWVDVAYASLISARAVAALSYAQTLSLLPVSLFGMAVSAAELPAMSQAFGSEEEITAQLRTRVNQGLARIAFFVVPSAVAFILLGDVVAGAVFQSGRFNFSDTRYVWYLLIGSAVGLLATTMGRLYASTFYALKDTRTPLYFASLRVLITAVLAYLSAVRLPSALGVPKELGGVAITATTGMAAWLELMLLRRGIQRRIGKTGIGAVRLLSLWTSALAAGGIGLGLKLGLARYWGAMASDPNQWEGRALAAPSLPPVLTAVIVLGIYGMLYFAFAALLRIPESAMIFRRLKHR